MNTLLSDALRSGLVLWILLKFNIAPLIRYTFGLPPRGKPYPVRVRLALEALGTTYLKLGQFMAMRFDLLPMELCVELQRLFENVPALPFETVRGVVEAELKGPLSQFFSDFQRRPIGAASIAQVHEARNHHNERLAIKVQRPNIDRVFEADMRILGRVAAAIDWMGSFPSVVLKDIVAEFATFTRRELDFVLEGRTADRLRINATANEKVPRIYWDLTTPRLLTMEFIDGLSIAHAGRLLHAHGAGAVAGKIAHFSVDEALHNLAFASLHQFFGTGFFHADPHPGNILLLPDNKIAFVDFGIFGSLTAEKRELLAGYTENVAVGNINEAYRYYAKLSTPTGLTDLAAFKRSTKEVLTEWYQSSLRLGTPSDERHVGKVIGEITDILRRHSVRVDLDTLLFWRAAIALDSSALSLSVNFDLIREMRYYFETESPSPAERVLEAALDFERAEALKEILTIAPRIIQEKLGAQTTDGSSAALMEESAPRRRGNNRNARAAILAALSLSACPLALQLQSEMMLAIAIILLMGVPMFSLLAVRLWQK
jgi:ubiquinone biosynthesis protein